jgi:hypothetical protein
MLNLNWCNQVKGTLQIRRGNYIEPINMASAWFVHTSPSRQWNILSDFISQSGGDSSIVPTTRSLFERKGLELFRVLQYTVLGQPFAKIHDVWAHFSARVVIGWVWYFTLQIECVVTLTTASTDGNLKLFQDAFFNMHSNMLHAHIGVMHIVGCITSRCDRNAFDINVRPCPFNCCRATCCWTNERSKGSTGKEPSFWEMLKTVIYVCAIPFWDTLFIDILLGNPIYLLTWC